MKKNQGQNMEGRNLQKYTNQRITANRNLPTVIIAHSKHRRCEKISHPPNRHLTHDVYDPDSSALQHLDHLQEKRENRSSWPDDVTLEQMAKTMFHMASPNYAQNMLNMP